MQTVDKVADCIFVAQLISRSQVLVVHQTMVTIGCLAFCDGHVLLLNRRVLTHYTGGDETRVSRTADLAKQSVCVGMAGDERLDPMRFMDTLPVLKLGEECCVPLWEVALKVFGEVVILSRTETWYTSKSVSEAAVGKDTDSAVKGDSTKLDVERVNLICVSSYHFNLGLGERIKVDEWLQDASTSHDAPFSQDCRVIEEATIDILWRSITLLNSVDVV